MLSTPRDVGRMIRRRGRKSKSEIDILRSAIVLTSAGLDASMKRLVTDVGRHLIMQNGTGARHEYEEQLKRDGETEGF